MSFLILVPLIFATYWPAANVSSLLSTARSLVSSSVATGGVTVSSDAVGAAGSGTVVSSAWGVVTSPAKKGTKASSSTCYILCIWLAGQSGTHNLVNRKKSILHIFQQNMHTLHKKIPGLLFWCRYFPVGMPCWNFVYSLQTDRGVQQLIFLSIPELFAWKGENQCVLVPTSYKLTSSISFDGGGRFFCCNRDISYLLISFGCNSWLCHLAAITGGLHNLLKQFRASLLQITDTLMKEISLLQRRLLKDSAIRREEIRLEPQKLRHCRFGTQEKQRTRFKSDPSFPVATKFLGVHKNQLARATRLIDCTR